ncbi:sensor histidine kinase [Alphaproteobacteria bacterium KMM 3653]|uniref:histidine kinase n=1 Tax=Harenicola maris TaxID=2841044 RepID=A0AAP2CR63_9RHOB|nr:sensor histidine kinase [Harenicola maris]
MSLPRVLSVLVFILCAVGSFWGSYLYFNAQELEAAAARLTLYRSTVEAELRNFSHMPFLLSQDPVVMETLEGGDSARLNHRLARFAQSAGIDAIYLMDQEGLTISASNAQLPSSFLGQNYAFRPYFQAALRGQLGEFYGVGATTGEPGYFLAMAVQTPTRQYGGVIAIKVDLSVLQESWEAAGERIILSNADGVVILASNPEWLYRSLGPIPEERRDRIIETRQFSNEPLAPLDWSPDLQRQTATLDGQRYLYLSSADLPNSWSLHFFAGDGQATARAWLTTGTLVMLGAVIFIFFQLRHVRQIGDALTQSEQKEAELRMANDRLAVEIEDRRLAEKNLKKTQDDLERAGRLAALGQLASSVTHELGQPIAAMRNQLAAAEMGTGASVLTTKMQGLVARMEDITRQLKFFSRKGRDQFESVDLSEVIDAALELVEPSIGAVAAEVHFVRPSEAIELYGNRMRLEQVVTNLVRNALDAVEGSGKRQVEIRLGQEDGKTWFEVADTGHGLDGKTMNDLREPFATTRESGKGMGLGLTISAGIVADHGGILTARERAEGGAIFRASFDPQQESNAA